MVLMHALLLKDKDKEKNYNKTRILVSCQAVLHTNNTTIGTQNEENDIFQCKGIPKKIQDYKHCFLKESREKEGEFSGIFIS